MTTRTRRSRAAVLAISALMLAGTLPALSASASASPAEDDRAQSYRTSGTAVKGSTTDCKTAPIVGPGQYVDTLVAEKDLYYRVKKRPDQLLQVSTTVVLAHRFTRNSSIEVFAGPMPADIKPEGWLHAFGTVVGWANVLSAGTRSEAVDPDDKSDPRPLPPDDMGCIRIHNRLSDDKDDPAFPVELLVGLADADPAKKAVPPAPQVRTGSDAQGGTSFADATPIGPGTYRQNLTVGQFPMWRVDVRPGQRLSIKGGVETPGDFPYDTAMAFTVVTFNELRQETICATDYSGRVVLFDRRKGRFEKSCGPWEIADPEKIRSNNLEYATPGTYYIQLAVAEPGESAIGRVVPVDMVVTVDGTPRAEPVPVFDFGGQSPETPGTGTVQTESDTGSAPGGTATGGSASPGKEAQQSGGTGTQGGKGTEGADGTEELPGSSASADGGSDDSTARKLALPVGIALGLALLGGVGYYGLRRR
ncbi:hypothetical protein [Yinghuangia sp. YIM S09857]|uniref:hypothetical protein n=1 Tax=Yinghuangia sp. YIM S09857 TaxID=3436929 RepID=UPI003F537150